MEHIPKASRTVRIEKLGAGLHASEVSGITIIWTATGPQTGPVIVGLYYDATVFRFMSPLEKQRSFIASA